MYTFDNLVFFPIKTPIHIKTYQLARSILLVSTVKRNLLYNKHFIIHL